METETLKEKEEKGRNNKINLEDKPEEIIVENKEKKNNIEKKGKREENPKSNLILKIDKENNFCVDCGKKDPTKVSINNGVIICKNCSLKHKDLGNSISFIKDINEDFDEYLLSFIVFGSNSKFKHFLLEEKVNPSFPIEKKYLTKACFFYRKDLKRKVNGEIFVIKKDYENPNEIIEFKNIRNIYPEFQHYIIKSKVIHNGALKIYQDNKIYKSKGDIKNQVEEKSFKKGKSDINFEGKEVTKEFKSIKNNVNIINKNESQKKEKERIINISKNLEKNENIITESERPLQERDQSIDDNEEQEIEEHKHIAKKNKEEEDDIEGMFDIE